MKQRAGKFFSKYWYGAASSSQKSKQPKAIVEPRYLAFENGYFMMLKYLSDMPLRDYGVFDSNSTASSNQGQKNAASLVKALPEIQWDSEVTYMRQVFDLRRVVLANYN